MNNMMAQASTTPVDIEIRRNIRLDFGDSPAVHQRGNPYLSHFWNALSVMAPSTERILMRVARDVRDEIRDERLEGLSAEERTVWDKRVGGEVLTREETPIYSAAYGKLMVSDNDLAERMPDDIRPRARYYAMKASEANVLSDRISSYASIVNYAYWKTRCEVEQSRITADARKYMML